MLRLGLLALMVACAAWAANIKLYLASGGYHLVREYQVQSDRVRYYSVERSDWEEIPLDLVDLDRTRAEEKARQAQLAKEDKLIAQENAAEGEVIDEAAKIPAEPGVYRVDGKTVAALKPGDAKYRTNKGHSILRRLSPTPASSTATLELEGAHAATVVASPSPEFYIRLSDEDQFGIARLIEDKGVRVVEEVTFEAVTKEATDAPATVDTYTSELDVRLYKIGPRSPLPPGEYAVFEYTPSEGNMRVWDFGVGK